VLNEVEAANIAALRDLLDQGDKRRSAKRIFRRDRAAFSASNSARG
jgi:hypothetical protein